MYKKMIDILKAELVPALGCTEPIAIALASAKAREVLGDMPDELTVECSSNIIKNAKSVVVPMTKNLKGIEAAAIVGMIGGDANKKLEVLTTVTEEDLEETKRLLTTGFCQTKFLQTTEKLHIIVHMKKGENSSLVELVKTHTGIARIEKDGVVIFEEEIEDCDGSTVDYSVASILEFANQVDIEEVRPILERQIEYNTKIAKEGLRNTYGVNVGSTLLDVYGDDVKIRAKAMPAAGSDARMNGCELPVIINSGSGNQGMTVSLPVIEFGKMLDVEDEKILRALIISNLIAIYQKSEIGRLSAYCGAVSAAAGAGAGITYLYGGNEEQINQTIINTLANVSGIVCDGAKSSCAAKIASAVDAAIVATMISLKGKGFLSGDGIVKDTIQKTIDGVVTLAKEGMQETDEVIVKIMLN
ncbi:L-cysteine desulfidase family protein [Lachnoclostridium sp.]|uniref:L-cysteine desulfidase family protein n=1 Tax=Lachnoclostridium sp. TaxID=2028282 RepID=UPI00289DFC7B|nr:L-serine ammonia-lyase, iron-sulfur-dependent, subunit alpha [Lachnoclostridium sp.]